MLQAVGSEVPVKVEFDNFEHGFPEGFLVLAAGAPGLLPHPAAGQVPPAARTESFRKPVLEIVEFNLDGDSIAHSLQHRSVPNYNAFPPPFREGAATSPPALPHKGGESRSETSWLTSIRSSYISACNTTRTSVEKSAHPI